MDALLGKLLLVAGQAVVVGLLLDEAPGAHRLLAAVAGETILMPTVAPMLHLFGAWRWRERGVGGRGGGTERVRLDQLESMAVC